MGSESGDLPAFQGSCISDRSWQGPAVSDKKMTLQEKLAFLGRPNSSFSYFQELKEGPIETLVLRLAIACLDRESGDASYLNFAIWCVAEVLWPHQLTQYGRFQIGFMAPNNVDHIAWLDINRCATFGGPPSKVTVRNTSGGHTIEMKSSDSLYDVFEAILNCEVAYMKRRCYPHITVPSLQLNKSDRKLLHDKVRTNPIKRDSHNLQVPNEASGKPKKRKSDSEFLFASKIRKEDHEWQWYDYGKTSIRQHFPPAQINRLALLDGLTFTGSVTISIWHLEPDPGEYVDRVQQMLRKAIRLLAKRSFKSAAQVLRLRRRICGELEPLFVTRCRKHAKNLYLGEMEDVLHVKYQSGSLETTVEHVLERGGQKRWITTVWL